MEALNGIDPIGALVMLGILGFFGYKMFTKNKDK